MEDEGNLTVQILPGGSPFTQRLVKKVISKTNNIKYPDKLPQCQFEYQH